ncbi:hypothetical protein KC325_g271 [Hortaea werneckii]|nr:hypothetical protein KC325_g271 [Hortaea werneckii]
MLFPLPSMYRTSSLKDSGLVPAASPPSRPCRLGLLELLTVALRAGDRHVGPPCASDDSLTWLVQQFVRLLGVPRRDSKSLESPIRMRVFDEIIVVGTQSPSESRGDRRGIMHACSIPAFIAPISSSRSRSNLL